MFELRKPQAGLKEITIKSLWYGFIAGMISGMVKIGWENIFPPRTIARNLINPPQHMAMQLGIPKDLVESFVYYSQDQKVFWFTLNPIRLCVTILACDWVVARCSIWYCALDHLARYFNASIRNGTSTLGSTFRRTLLRILGTHRMGMVNCKYCFLPYC